MEQNMPQPHHKKQHLFKTKKPSSIEPSASTMSVINDVERRLRVLEERYNTLQKKTQVIEENMLNHFKKLNTSAKTLTSEIDDFKKKLQIVNEKTDLVIKELRLTAKKEEVEVLKRYLDLWQPVNFVTQTQVEKIVDEFIDKKLSEKTKSLKTQK